MQPHQLVLPGTPAAIATDAPLAEACAAFLRARRISANTRQRYAWTFEKLSRFFGDATPADSEQLDEFLNAQRELAPSSLDALYRDVRAFFAWRSARLGLANPAANIERPRMKQKLPRVLSDLDVRQLLARTTHHRDRALIAFALDTGARLGEITALRRHDIEQRTTLDGHVRYQARITGKTGDRLVPVSTPAAQLLIGVGEGETLWTSETGNPGHAPGEPLTAHGIKLIVQRATLRALGRRINAHALRHTMATMYLRNGGDLESLRRILGHTKLETTLVYLHLVADDLSDRHEHFSPVAMQGAQRP